MDFSCSEGASVDRSLKGATFFVFISTLNSHTDLIGAWQCADWRAFTHLHARQSHSFNNGGIRYRVRGG